MKLALVTETFPPEVNGVSMTLGRLVEGLSEKGYLAPFDDSEGFQNLTREVMKRKVVELAEIRNSAREAALSVSWDRVVEDFQRSLVVVENSYREMYERAV